MSVQFRASVVWSVVWVCAWVVVGTQPVQAELVDIAAVVDATAVQFNDGVATLVDRETVDALAGETRTAVATTGDGGGALGTASLASATSAVFFRDPFNPGPPGDLLGEFGGELLAVTLDPTINQQITGDVFETRTVQVTALEAGVPVGSAAAISGEMYLNGAALVWWDRRDNTVDGIPNMEALIGFEIELERASGESLFVASGAIEIRGTADQQLSVEAQEAISPDDLVVVDLSADFPEMGTVYLVLFPQMLMPYVYQATVGEPYTLVARLRLKGTTAPLKTGVAITTGGPFETIAGTLDRFYGFNLGTRLQSRVAAELGLFPLPAIPVLDLEEVSRACGATGAEAVALAGLVGLMSFTAGGRRMIRRRFRR